MPLRLTDTFRAYSSAPFEQPAGTGARTTYEQAGPSSLAAFENSEERLKMMNEMEASAGKIADYMDAKTPDAARRYQAAFNELTRRMREGRTGHFSTRMEPLYRQGVPHLHEIADSIDDPRLDDDQRRMHLDNLFVEMNMCGDGVLTFLEDAAKGLRAEAGGFRDNIRYTYDRIVSTSIEEWTAQRHMHEPNFWNNKVHIENHYRNSLAESGLGIKPSSDGFVDQYKNQPAYDATALIGVVRDRCTPEALIEKMALECKEKIDSQYAFYKGRDLSADEQNEAHLNFEKKFKYELKELFGDIAWSDIITNEPGEPCRFREGAELLAVAIKKSAKQVLVDNQRFVEREERDLPLATRTENDDQLRVDIKKIGSQFYVKEKEKVKFVDFQGNSRERETVARRPLERDDVKWLLEEAASFPPDRALSFDNLVALTGHKRETVDLRAVQRPEFIQYGLSKRDTFSQLVYQGVRNELREVPVPATSADALAFWDRAADVMSHTSDGLQPLVHALAQRMPQAEHRIRFLGSDQVNLARGDDEHVDAMVLELTRQSVNLPPSEWREHVTPVDLWSIWSRTEAGRARAGEVLPTLVRVAAEGPINGPAVPEPLLKLMSDEAVQDVIRGNEDLQLAVAQAYSSGRSPLAGEPLENILAALNGYHEGAARLGLPTCEPIFGECLELSLQIGRGLEYLQSPLVRDLRSKNAELDKSYLTQFASFETAGVFDIGTFDQTIRRLHQLTDEIPAGIIEDLTQSAFDAASATGAGFDLLASETLSLCLTREPSWAKTVVQGTLQMDLAGRDDVPDLLATFWDEAEEALVRRPEADRARAFGAIRVAAREVGCEEAFMAHPTTKDWLQKEPSLAGANPGVS